MRWQEYVNADEVRKAIRCLQPPGEVFEVRAIGTAKKDILSGYFKDAETLLRAFDTIDMRQRNIYVTLGKVKSECFARAQSERFLKSPQTSSDGDIAGYRWLFVDLDPVRAAGISSSNEELAEAEQLARKVYAYLKDLGFTEPVKALSGNGCHLLYRIQIANNEDGRGLVERCLKSLATTFDTSRVKIDTTNYNPSRICKLHGTLAQKGTSTADRPHRMSRIFSVPEVIRPTEKVFLEKLAGEMPEPERSGVANRYSIPEQEFDLLDFMRRHGLTYEEDSNDRAKIYKLDACPFDASHKDGDAKIFQYADGAISFKCHHNSCRSYKWQDVRMKFEPDAYDHGPDPRDSARIDEGWKQHNRDKTPDEVPYEELPEDTAEMFRTAAEIYNDPEPEYEYIRSGITEIDDKLHGLQKSGLSVISGNRGSGKSTLLGQLIIQAISDGHNVVCYSGELNNKKYLSWLIRQAAGRSHVELTARGSYVPDATARKIVDWMGEHFRLYNNKCGNSFAKIEKQLRSRLKEYKADLCIIDNLMALDLSTYDRDKYDAQTKFVWALKNLAELSNSHIIFVAHPKKADGFLRLNDISGTGNIGNIVDNAFLIHRNNRDFKTGYKDLFGREPHRDGIVDEVTNIIEIAKDREYGHQDEFVSLFFEETTKRLRNAPDENTHYGWEPDEQDFEPADDLENIPF